MKYLPWIALLVSGVALTGCGSDAPFSPETALPPAENSASLPPREESSVKGSSTVPTTQPDGAQSRRFQFHYRFRVKNLASTGDSVVRMWLPVPSTTASQQIERLAASAPRELSEHQETRYGNKLLYMECPVPAEGGFEIDVPYKVVRHEVLRPGLVNQADADELGDALRSQFLAADKMVPIAGKPLAMLDAVELEKNPRDLARQLYDLVDAHVAYKKEGTGWGRGDSNWVCDSGYGNCTDFHSLFISLARSQGLPARFEIGFSIPTDRTEGPIAGYHCWAWFYLDKRGWVPVDISEADKHPELKDYYFGNLTADRVMFSIGRDIELSPESANEPLNFFIYPHIEVGGEPLPKDNVELLLSFQDL